MRNSLFLLFLGVVALFLQSVWHYVCPEYIVPVAPNVLAILLVFIAFHYPTALGACMAFLIGFEFDIWSGRILGPHATALVSVFLPLALASQRMFIESAVTIVLSTVFAVFVGNLVYALVAGCFIAVEPLGFVVFKRLGLEALITAVVAVPIMPGLVNIRQRWLLPHERDMSALGY